MDVAAMAEASADRPLIPNTDASAGAAATAPPSAGVTTTSLEAKPCALCGRTGHGALRHVGSGVRPVHVD